MQQWKTPVHLLGLAISASLASPRHLSAKENLPKNPQASEVERLEAEIHSNRLRAESLGQGVEACHRVREYLNKIEMSKSLALIREDFDFIFNRHIQWMNSFTDLLRNSAFALAAVVTTSDLRQA